MLTDAMVELLRATGDLPPEGGRHVVAKRRTATSQWWYRVVTTLSSLLALAVLIAEYGFVHPWDMPIGREVVALIAAAGFLVTRIGGWLGPNRQDYSAEHHFDALLMLFAALAVAAAAAGLVGAVHNALLATLHTYLLFMLGLQLVRVNRITLEWGSRSPARLLVMSFVVLVTVGGAVLFLPICSHADYSPNYVMDHVVNSIFTATSAACVTGLTVTDTGSFYTFAGQAVILLLIQVGGLSISIFGAVTGMLLGQKMSLASTVTLGEFSGANTLSGVLSLTRFVVFGTAMIEGVGALLLWGLWPAGWSWEHKLWFSLFHSVSAFCNAGFGLLTDNLVSLNDRWQTHTVVTSLIILGGLGFPVLAAVKGCLVSVAGRWLDRKSGAAAVRPIRRLDLSSKVVLTTTAICLIGGTLLLFVSETYRQKGINMNRGVTVSDTQVRDSAGRMDRMSDGMRLANAWFQSVTARTAGFSTVSLSEQDMSASGHFTLIVLMFIGGSPVSCAGGVKTTTVAVLVLAVVATIRNRQNVEAFRRQVPLDVIRRASAIFIMYLGTLIVVSAAMLFTQDQTFVSLMFESASALGTVGLSTGITPYLSNGGKLILTAAMLAGRVGPLTVLLALPRRQTTGSYGYANESLMLG